MIKPFYTTFFTFSLLLIASAAFCQKDSLAIAIKSKMEDSTKSKPKSSFKIGVNYLSNNVFMGRTDSVRVPAILPTIKYTFKSGIYLSGALDILPNSKNKKVDGGDLAAGYDFDITDDFTGGVSFTKLFYSSKSTQVAAASSASVNANFSYDIGDIITPAINADYSFNKQGITDDKFVNFSLSHDLIFLGIFGDVDLILVSPTVSANTGTQNFYLAYITKKQLKTAKANALENAIIAKYTAQLGKFELLDYEASIPFEYKYKHFIFQFTPTYAVVKNELPKGIETRIASLPSVFYFETGVALKF